MGLDDIWDSITDCFFYVISFEWFGDIRDFIGGMFENMGEFSIMGLVFGILTFLFVFLLKDYMLQPFLDHMSSTSAIFWSVMTYLCCIVVGYFVGKQMFDNS